MNFPLVSVIMPVYNASFYIREAIESILSQEFIDFEFIIINDGSTDNSEEIILSYSDVRIKYVKNENNLKIISTLNKGFEMAKGKYIARMDADDISDPLRFTKQIKLLENNPEIGILGTYVQQIGESDKLVCYPENDEDIRYSLIFFNPFVHSSVFIRKSIIDEFCLQFSQNMLHVEDYDMWMRILQYTKGMNLPEVLLKYRVHKNQISSIHSEYQRQNNDLLRGNYLLSLGLDVGLSKNITVLFSQEEFLEINSLILLMNTVSKNGFFSVSNFNSRLKKDILKLTKDRILSKSYISLNEYKLLILHSNYFTLKQFLSLTIRFIFSNKLF